MKKLLLLSLLLFFFVSFTSAQTGDKLKRAYFRKENVQLISGDSLLNYNVVIDSYHLKANAEALQNTLINMGYPARIVSVKRSNGLLYRVIADSFSAKSDAVRLKDSMDVMYPDSWLLYTPQKPMPVGTTTTNSNNITSIKKGGGSQ